MPSIEERFWAGVDKNGPIPEHCAELGNCWLWTKYCNRKGYGSISSGSCGRGTLKTHRLSWELHNSPVPEGLWVLHRCDNTTCVRPDHLFLGTAKDNYEDMRTKGRECPHIIRAPRGDGHYRSRLSTAVVLEIFAWRAKEPEVQFKTMAKKYNVSDSTIRDVFHRRLWRHVDIPEEHLPRCAHRPSDSA